jgi:hypothetical protein
MGFVEWMKSADLSEKSANNYLGALKGPLAFPHRHGHFR